MTERSIKPSQAKNPISNFDLQDYEAETLEANCLDMLSLVALKLFLGVQMDLIKVWYHVIIGPTTFMK